MTNPALLPGEKIETFAGFPTLTYFKEKDPNAPLVVFITAAVLARASYGLSVSKKEDFIAHHFKEAGYSFLALNYPMEHPIFDSVYPEFTLSDWGNQTHDAISKYLEKSHKSKEVILILWGVGSRVLFPLINTARKSKKFTFKSITSLSGGPPVPMLTSVYHGQFHKSETGLSDISKTLNPFLIQCLHEHNDINARKIVSDDIFANELFANVPVSIWGTTSRFLNEGFFDDFSALVHDLQIGAVNDLPLFTHIRPKSETLTFTLMNHALVDNGAWKMMVNQQIFQNYVVPNQASCPDIKSKKWQSLIDLVESSYDQLSDDIDGNIMCLMGEKTASILVSKILKLKDIACALDLKLNGIFN